ncbi:MAG: stage V sporulation protein AD [Evtepia sp.]
MDTKRIGTQTVALSHPPSILGVGNAVGKKEAAGPLSAYFDYSSIDDTFDESSWEKSESSMQTMALKTALKRSGLTPMKLDYLLAGDLLNQCIATTFCARDFKIPFFGLYGACSTMAESLSLSAMLIDGGFADHIAAITSSHFCSAERQYRSPLEYGGQRTPTAQWTVTGSGAVILAKSGAGPYITHVTTGKIIDKGITDVNNMGAAMAAAAYATITTHLSDTNRPPNFYDLIVTGDLGKLGKEIVLDLFATDGITLRNYDDCGVLIYNAEQDAHAGGSGCGCSAVVLTAYLLPEMRKGRWNNILFCGTGALHSPTSAMQGESIPGICHAIALSRKKGATNHDL